MTRNQKMIAARLGVWIVLLLLLLSSTGFAVAQAIDSAALRSNVEAASLGETKNLHRVDQLYLAGQFEPTDIPAIQAAKIGRVITLRRAEEITWDERKETVAAGLEFIELPVGDPSDLTDELFAEVRRILRESEGKPTLLHCATANRVGAVWLAYRVLDQNVPWETALAEAKSVGLRSEALTAKAQDYVDSQLHKPAVPPDLNKDFLDPNLDVDQWIQRFEVESREIFAERLEILKQCGVQTGFEIADVGAGTGLFTRLLAHEAGDQGHVFAVEISPAFLNHINLMAKQLALTNVTAVLCREDSVSLPAESVDLVFICDTYHHFAFPSETLRTIRQALRPGGMLVVVDFEKIPSVSREWIIDHVRADKKTVQQEIASAGFEFVDEPKVAGLKENYMLRFKK